ncbi:MAG TPA: hypothetical protein VN848_06070 [Gemmatimonadales bacterium]|nr:hypothetical protein [Gemmatimonadales bacterium]
MITQRISPLVSLLLLSAAVPAALSASVIAYTRSPAVHVGSKRGAETTIQVANNGGQAANVILVDQGWYVLGLVGSKATKVFDVPRDFVGTKDITILAPLQKLTGFESKPMTLRLGRAVNLSIPATLSELDVA